MERQPTIILERKQHNVELLPLYDLHYGSKECDEGLVHRGIEYIKNHHQCFTFLGGDAIECAVYGSLGNVHQQKHQLTEQVQNVVRMLMPIKNKILFAITGNHENRVEKSTGLNLVHLMCDMLEIPYCGWEAHALIRFKRNKFCKLYAHHGSGGGQTSGAKLNAIERLHWRAPHANIIIAGHTHFSTSSMREIRYIDNRGILRAYTQYFMACGSAHKSDGYAAMKGYSPLCTNFNIMRIHSGPTDFDMDVKHLK